MLLGDPGYYIVSDYVSRPDCSNGHPDAPLLYAIGCALARGGETLDLCLIGVFPPYPSGVLGGGDPGWLWYHDTDKDGNDVVVVEITDVMAPPNGMWNEYYPDKVRYEIRAALNNTAVKEPEALSEVDRVIRLFNLEQVETPEGLMPIPDWDGKIPSKLIRNK
jgi:hypothetical protein